MPTYYDRFEQHVSPKSNPVFARYKFHQKIQSPDESVEQFTTELQILTQDCEFTNTDEMIRNRIVFGTKSMKNREKLFDEGAGLTLERAINIARSYEASQAQLKAMNPAANKGKIDVISRPKSRNIQPKHGTSAQAAQQCNLKSTQAAHWHCDENPANNCKNCGRSHNKSEACPARGQTCNYCKKKGHFIQVCRKRMRSKQRIHEIQDTAISFEENFETLAFEPICVGNINQEIKAHKDEVFPTVNVNIAGRGKEETTLKAKIDTGAQGNVLPLHIYHNMYPQNINANSKPRPRTLSQSKVILVAYGGSEIKHFGTAKIPCEFKGIKITATFYLRHQRSHNHRSSHRNSTQPCEIQSRSEKISTT